jgi:hypothetical protein
MLRSVRFALAGLLLLPFAAQADLLVIPEGAEPTTPVDKPDKGMSMTQVHAKYGEPTGKHPPVGGASKFQPPITRWDYPQFSVVFEHDHVIDAVVPEQPAKIYPTEELKPVNAPAEAPAETPTP